MNWFCFNACFSKINVGPGLPICTALHPVCTYVLNAAAQQGPLSGIYCCSFILNLRSTTSNKLLFLFLRGRIFWEEAVFWEWDILLLVHTQTEGLLCILQQLIIQFFLLKIRLMFRHMSRYQSYVRGRFDSCFLSCQDW